MQVGSRSIIAIAILLVGLIYVEHGLAQTITERREAAVLKARAGHMNEALAELRGMVAAGAEDGLVAMDLAALLQQTRKAREAVTVFEKSAVSEPPEYALLALTRAYRDLHRYDVAARLARQGLKRFYDRPVWPLLLSLVLSDARRSREALDILRAPEAQRAPLVERLLAEGYAWRRAGKAGTAKRVYSEVLKLAAASNDARAEATRALREMSTRDTAAQSAPTASPPAPGEAADAGLRRVERRLNAMPPEPAEGRRRLLREAAVLKARTGRMAEAQTDLRALLGAGDTDG